MQNAKQIPHAQNFQQTEIDWLLEQIKVEREREIKNRLQLVSTHEEKPKAEASKPKTELWLPYWPI